MQQRLVSRRQLVGGLGALGASSLAGACAGEPDVSRARSGSGADGAAGPAARAEAGTSGSGRSAADAAGGRHVDAAAPSCVLTASQTAGPFFFPTGLERADIREGKPGVPLIVELMLVTAPVCAPLADAIVELWHADVAGAYSGYGRADGNPSDAVGETYLRGFQHTDRTGRVAFETVYPGWYPGRTLHLHAHVVLAAGAALTTQLYFPEPINDAVMAREPYAARGPRSVFNATDGIPALPELTLEVEPLRDGYRGRLVLGIAGPS